MLLALGLAHLLALLILLTALGERAAHLVEHLLQLAHHLLGGVFRTLAHQFLDLVEHLLQILHVGDLLIGIHLHQLAAILQLLHQRGHELVHHLAQFVHQPVDFFRRGVAIERLLQRLLRRQQIAVGVGRHAFLELDGGIPQDALHLGDRAIAAILLQARARDAQRQIHRRIVVEALGLLSHTFEFECGQAPVAHLHGQVLANVVQLARDRMAEAAFRQHQRFDGRHTNLFALIRGDQMYQDRQSGPDVRNEIMIGFGRHLGLVAARQGQADQDFVFAVGHGLAVEPADRSGKRLQAVIVGRGIGQGDAQLARRFRRRSEFDDGRQVRRDR